MNIRRALSNFVYQHRLLGKRAVSFCNKILPRSVSRLLTNLAEKVAFRLSPSYQADTLPPIFHYWSGRYLAPVLAKFQLRSPEDLYLKKIIEISKSSNVEGQVRIASLGSGAGHMEISLLEQLNEAGVSATLDCVDFNSSLRDQAMRLASERGVSDSFRFFVEDCNNLNGQRLYDVIIVNQFFHHVEDLGSFCRAIQRQLRLHGVLLTCDVIGRNGHVLWPSVDRVVQDIWRTLSPERKFDRYFNKVSDKYVSIDHSAYSNEGIKAQDIIENLASHFDFELFIGYGAAIMPFVERRIGFNFDLDSSDDRSFIDKVASMDAEAISAMRYPASNMIAMLRLPGAGRSHSFFPISPYEHLRLVNAEKLLTSA